MSYLDLLEEVEQDLPKEEEELHDAAHDTDAELADDEDTKALDEADDGVELEGELTPEDDQMLGEFARTLNLFSTEMLSEAPNIVRLNRATRLNNLASRTALVLAKRKGDPLYTKYTKFNAMRIALRRKIIKKYGSKANTHARKLLAGTAPKPAAKK